MDSEIANSSKHIEHSWPQWVCPLHSQELDENDNVSRGSCGCAFPIKNEILRFVADGDYSAAFGLQWKRYRKTQLDSYTGLPLSRVRLRRCLGEMLWSQLHGKDVLEAGCGAGRFTEILLEEGAYVTSFDLSEAVEANQENFPQGNRHRIAQANILQIPFKINQFDIVICLGVVQHTPIPEETMRSLYAQVKPGGWLVVDHYTYGISYFTKTFPIFRYYFRRLEPDVGLKKTEALVNLLWPLHQAVRNSPVLHILLSRLSPVLDYYRAHPGLSDDLQKEWAMLDTHDLLTDWYKHLRTNRQIRLALEHMGLSNIWCENGGNGIEARGQRPELICDNEC